MSVISTTIMRSRPALRRILAAAFAAIAVTGGALTITTQPASAQTVRESIVSLATQQLGGKGCSPGYLNSCGIDWCAEFARWAWKNGGVTDLRGLNSFADSFRTAKSVHYHGRSSGYQPQPGDAIMFDWAANPPGSGRIADHVAIVTSVSGGRVHTIGGNQDGTTPTNSQVSRTSYALTYTKILGYAEPDNGGGSSPSPGPADPDRVWVDTFANAPVFGSPTSTTPTGTLNKGTNYVFCKVAGREIREGSSFNHWWLKTDPDIGPADQYVSAYYLSRWGNDVAKDNSGAEIRNCAGPPPPPAPGSKYWVDTFANAPGYGSATSTVSTGTLNKGTNYVFCKVAGREIREGSNYNHWWLKTDLDTGPANQYVSAYYLSRWGNDVAKDNNGVVIPTC